MTLDSVLGLQKPCADVQHTLSDTCCDTSLLSFGQWKICQQPPRDAAHLLINRKVLPLKTWPMLGATQIQILTPFIHSSIDDQSPHLLWSLCLIVMLFDVIQICVIFTLKLNHFFSFSSVSDPRKVHETVLRPKENWFWKLESSVHQKSTCLMSSAFAAHREVFVFSTKCLNVSIVPFTMSLAVSFFPGGITEHPWKSFKSWSTLSLGSVDSIVVDSLASLKNNHLSTCKRSLLLCVQLNFDCVKTVKLGMGLFGLSEWHFSRWFINTALLHIFCLVCMCDNLQCFSFGRIFCPWGALFVLFFLVNDSQIKGFLHFLFSSCWKLSVDLGSLWTSIFHQAHWQN